MNSTELMKRAIELAKLGANYVHPNPRVGAVIVRNDEIISEGYHKYFGAPHAEIDAIENAKGVDLEGATLVVNLEPCVHYGKTPPCVDAIIEKKFAKVIIGMIDPNPLVSGQGVKKLQDAGIEVEVGVLEKECKWLNRFFIKTITTGKPYVMFKIAQTLNGAIATREYESKWITSPETRELALLLRREVDAILVGRNTALKDNPALTLHQLEGKTPWRVILDSNLSLPLELQIFIDEIRRRTIVVVDQKLPPSRKRENLTLAGMKILEVPTENGLISLPSLIERLKEDFQINVIMVEGGSQTLSSFLEAGLWDEIQFFISPKILPGGLNAFEGYTIPQLSEATELEILFVEPIGKDLHIVGVNNNTFKQVF